MEKVDEQIRRNIHGYIEVKRLFKFQRMVLDHCAGKEIKNELLYEQLLATSVDGLVLRLTNLGQSIFTLLSRINGSHSNEFYPEVIDSHINEIAHDEIGYKKYAKSYLENIYSELFPLMKFEKRTRPNQNDFLFMRMKLEEVLKPVKAHRDTVVAHKDDRPKAATFENVQELLDYVEKFLANLYMLHSHSSYEMDFGGMAADISQTAEDFAELILLNSYQRELKAKGQDYE
jgi:hypothetical protein